MFNETIKSKFSGGGSNNSAAPHVIFQIKLIYIYFLIIQINRIIIACMDLSNEN